MDAIRVAEESTQPVPRTNPGFRSLSGRRPVGEVRLPLGGPYRPRARLYRLSDGRLLWCVRLWEVDRPVLRVVSTATLLRFARGNRLPALEAEVEALVERALRGKGT
ncbi:MAG TPA: hypothetical protein VEH57_08250 [Thermoplasmata archaeon]|nr:hypothetical protein [Thermoplasmata archaeon]